MIRGLFRPRTLTTHGSQAYCPPRGHDHAYQQQESRPARPERSLSALRHLTTAVFVHGEAVANHEREAQRHGHLRKKRVEIENVRHRPHGSRGSLDAPAAEVSVRHCFVVRVFTRGEEGGNHLGIITDPVGLTDDSMQQIATDLGFSETIFVDSMQGPVPNVRIYTPTIELPFAGHPLVGAAWILNTMAPERHASLTCAVGEVGLSWDGDRAWIDVALDHDVRRRDDFPAEDLGFSTVVAVHEVRMPLEYLVVELADSSGVADYQPRMETLSGHPDGQHISIWSRIDDSTIHTRFFAPKMGILEDPATGSAAVALAATLRHTGEETGSQTLLQGAEMGFPSEIALSWNGSFARLGGKVVHDEVREINL